MPKDTTTRFQGVYARYRKGCSGLAMLMQAFLLGQGVGSRSRPKRQDRHARHAVGRVERAR
jgi:hypothetical protein